MKKFRFLLICLMLLAVMLTSIACNDTADGTNGGEEESSSETTAFVTDTEGFTIPENVKLEESAILSSAAQAWDLSDGGTAGTALSANGKTDATHNYGVWLKNNTFGYALDFSTEGSYALAESTDYAPANGFAISAWVKAPVREDGKRVIVSEEALTTYTYDNIEYIDNMERKANWVSSGTVDAVRGDAKEGNAYVEAAISAKGDLSLSRSIKRMDISDYMENGYLHMWISVEGSANVIGGQLELTSSAAPDRNEINFSSIKLDGDNVWTEVYFKLSDAETAGGEFDPKNLNFFRFYLNTTGPVTVRVDDLYFCNRIEDKPEEGWQMFINEAGELDFAAVGLTGLESSGAMIVDGNWHHTMVSYDGETFIYYIDGTAVKACAVTGTPVINSTSIVIGADADYANHFDGSVAEVRLFDSAKTPGETTATVLDVTDNEKKAPRMDMQKGLVFDRRQYYGSDSRVIEPTAVVGYDDITAAMNMGFDHVKLLLTPNHLIAEDGSLKVEEMEYITWLIDENLVSQGFRAILCIHPEEPFKPTYLGNLGNFELLCKWYGEFAQYVGEHWTPDQISIQLMTEPGAQDESVDWTWYSDRMWGAVRNVLPEHTILTSSDAAGNLERLKLMSPATDDNLIYTFTTYEPYTIGFGTFNGNSSEIWANMQEVPYPIEEGVDYTEAIEHSIANMPANLKDEARKLLEDYVNGISDNGTHYVNNYDSLYNAEWHMLRAKSLDDWRQKYGGNIHIMCVEFGCMYPEKSMQVFGANYMGLDHETRYQFIKDMRSGFDAYDIGWSYWSYNEAFTLFIPEYALKIGGTFPEAETIMQIVDYRLLEDSLGVTPVKKFTLPASLTDAVQAWTLGENGAELAASGVILGIKGKYMGTSAVEYGDAYAAAINADGQYIIAEDTGINLGRAFAVAADIKVENTGKVQALVSQGEGFWEDPENVGKFMLYNFDDVFGMWGTAEIKEGTEAPAEGTGYAQSTANELIVFCKVWNDPLDLSVYEENGALHLSIYVEDASKLSEGTGHIELSTDTSLTQVMTWTIPELKDGWNDIKIPFTDATGKRADLSSIAMTRIFHYTTAETTIGVDNFFVSLEGDIDPIISWEMFVNEAGELDFTAEGLEGIESSGTVVADGAWHKVMVSYNGQNLVYYVDGKEVASIKASGMGAGASGSSDTFIGANSAHKDTISGAIANVAIYNRPKTPADIAE